jgi:hypothetical protein
MWLYHRGVELPITNYKFLYKVNDVQQGFSKVEDAGEGLVRRRGEAPTRARDIGNVMPIHQGEHYRHMQHLLLYVRLVSDI